MSRHLNDHKNGVHEDGRRIFCLGEQGGQEGASSCKKKSFHLEILKFRN